MKKTESPGLKRGLLRVPSFAKKAAYTAAVVGGTVASSMAELPEEFDVATHMTTLAGYVLSAGAAGLGVFVAFRTVGLIASALKKMMH